jgi:hypothetical protein
MTSWPLIPPAALPATPAQDEFEFGRPKIAVHGSAEAHFLRVFSESIPESAVVLNER